MLERVLEEKAAQINAMETELYKLKVDSKSEKLQSAWTKDQIEKLEQKLLALMQEHDEAGKLIKLLAAMKQELPDYCNTVKNSKKLLTELEENLYIHVHLENNILFKRVLASINKI